MRGGKSERGRTSVSVREGKKVCVCARPGGNERENVCVCVAGYGLLQGMAWQGMARCSLAHLVLEKQLADGGVAMLHGQAQRPLLASEVRNRPLRVDGVGRGVGLEEDLHHRLCGGGGEEEEEALGGGDDWGQ